MPVTATISAFPAFVPAQDAATFGTVPPPNAPPPTADRVQLSAGVDDVLKLSRAKVNEDVVIAFIQNGNRHFALTASEIL